MVDSLLPHSLVDGRYAVERELGRGGMARVYLARDLTAGRAVALKVVVPSRIAGGESLERIRGEGARLATVRSDHVVQVYASGEDGDAFYFAMELVRGAALDAIIREHADRGVTVPLVRALTIARQVAAGLAAVHRAGLVHRDVKPANILVEEDTGRPVLIDFGLAGAADATSSTPLCGTPAYMPPEQGMLAPEGAVVSARTDVYALACTVFELLTGAPPFLAESVFDLISKHALEPAPKVSSLRPDLFGFDDALASALAKDPAARFAGPEALDAAYESMRERAPSSIAFEAAAAARGPISAALLETVAAPSRDALRILIVDDDNAFGRFAARATELVFRDLPIEIALASSGEEALAAARRAMPHLVLLDFDMPRLNGVEALSRLRALPGGIHPRAVVISARAGATEQWQFSVLGVRDFLDKPIHLQALCAKIADVAARAGWTAAKPALA